MSGIDLSHPPIQPIAELAAWQALHRKIAAQPLALCPDFPRLARRHEAWWAHEGLDVPLLLAQANANPARPINRRLELLDNPQAWLDAKRRDAEQLHRVGDALPHVRADFGPVFLGGMFGGKLEFGADTGWTHPCIDDDWSNCPTWQLDPNNAWWKRLHAIVALAAADGAGRYLICTPDLGGSADVLLNLRGPVGLCTDMIDRPEAVEGHLHAIYDGWRKVFVDLYATALRHGAGLIHWLGLWSNRPYMIPACDFNYMIGPDDFNRYLLPDIAHQAATVGRAVFHLDGPGAAKHYRSLLEVPEIEAIQFTPGEGTPSALAWLDMFRDIQAHGRSLLIITPPGELLELCRELRPEGLGILLGGGLNVKQLDELYQALRRQCGAPK